VDLAIVKIPLRPDRAVCIGWAVAAYRHMLKSSCAEPPSDIFAEKKKIRLVFFGKRVCVTEREREGTWTRPRSLGQTHVAVGSHPMSGKRSTERVSWARKAILIIPKKSGW
jgi:hypothetical protein